MHWYIHCTYIVHKLHIPWLVGEKELDKNLQDDASGWKIMAREERLKSLQKGTTYQESKCWPSSSLPSLLLKVSSLSPQPQPAILLDALLRDLVFLHLHKLKYLKAPY